MLNYFRLQLLLNSRKLRDAGVHPVVGFLLIAVAFIAGSFFLFYKTMYAPYLYVFMALGSVSPLSEKSRNDFLLLSFGTARYRQVRVLENLLVALPFVAFLCYKLQFVWAVSLLVVAVLWVFNSLNTQLSFTIPTPFGHKPYEFAVGFRGTFWVVLIAYALVAIGIAVGNFNLGVFALLLLFGIILSYYFQSEPEYFVWSHNTKPVRFLLGKVKTAVVYATILALPMVITLAVFFDEKALIPAGVMLLGYLYIVCTITARYAAYPEDISIPQGILLTVCLVMPPAIIFILPYFINASTKRLQPVLK
jgi:hypothetical protein